jgi:hypothetical protein
MKELITHLHLQDFSLEDADWEEKISRAIRIQQQILIGRNGMVRLIGAPEDLFDIDLEPYDLLFVGPHGEILPLVILAVRQKVLHQTDNLVVHIDAHYDKERKSSDVQNPLPIEDLITRFLKEPFEVCARELLYQIINATTGDVVTFNYLLRKELGFIIASIRHEGSSAKQSQTIGPMRMRRYTNTEEDIATYRHRKNKSDGSSPLKEFIPNLYSIDADFTGAETEHDAISQLPIKQQEFRKQQLFQQTFTMLISQLQREQELVSQRKADPTKKGPLFAVSLDPDFVTFPENFTLRFLKEFYIPLIHMISGKRKV